mmetsp:Transcript_139997/g.447750  ORF Transcript_139997/g.447750 Transcript_139997/m.447750 type:complete len:310 (-) Transcript_139997:1646-2575(-)
MDVVTGEELQQGRSFQRRLTLHPTCGRSLRRRRRTFRRWVHKGQCKARRLFPEWALQQPQEAESEVIGEVLNDRFRRSLALQRPQRFQQDTRVLARRRVRNLPQINRPETTLPPELIQLRRETEGRTEVVQLVRRRDLRDRLKERRNLAGLDVLLQETALALAFFPLLLRCGEWITKRTVTTCSLLEPRSELPQRLRRIALAVQRRVRRDAYDTCAAELREAVVQELLRQRPRNEVSRGQLPSLQGGFNRLLRQCPFHADLDAHHDLRQICMLGVRIDRRQQHQQVMCRSIGHKQQVVWRVLVVTRHEE